MRGTPVRVREWCKEWRKAQLRVGAPLRSRVDSDVILPGSVALVKWALREGCPRVNRPTRGRFSVNLVQLHKLLRAEGCAIDAWSSSCGDVAECLLTNRHHHKPYQS